VLRASSFAKSAKGWDTRIESQTSLRNLVAGAEIDSYANKIKTKSPATPVTRLNVTRRVGGGASD
jgi:hypothetical protein